MRSNGTTGLDGRLVEQFITPSRVSADMLLPFIRKLWDPKLVPAVVKIPDTISNEDLGWRTGHFKEGHNSIAGYAM